eukprot:TRINITY_DN12227_c0_g1_i5.p1 TRINITY_DN12227_c0_g1~~TRINITY_DN12227_c0_g1_i5.p1  ORF type:complete len:558 (-),score=113.93 TRINITY_DN12227_c0_g1_i5:47-1720(-)
MQADVVLLKERVAKLMQQVAALTSTEPEKNASQPGQSLPATRLEARAASKMAAAAAPDGVATSREQKLVGQPAGKAASSPPSSFAARVSSADVSQEDVVLLEGAHASPLPSLAVGEQHELREMIAAAEAELATMKESMGSLAAAVQDLQSSDTAGTCAEKPGSAGKEQAASQQDEKAPQYDREIGELKSSVASLWDQLRNAQMSKFVDSLSERSEVKDRGGPVAVQDAANDKVPSPRDETKMSVPAEEKTTFAAGLQSKRPEALTAVDSPAVERGERPGSEPAAAGGLAHKPMLLADALNLSLYCYALPPSTYTVALLLGVLESTKEMSSLKYYRKAFSLHAFNLVLQGGCVFLLYELMLYHWRNWHTTECYELETVPLFACLFCFLCSVVNDMQECTNMAEAVWRIISTTEETSTLFFERDEHGNLRPVPGAGGMSVRRKVKVCCMVILPKLGLAIAVLFIGCLFLAMSTSNTELLLNCMALTFILDIDELLFKTMTSDEVSRLITSMPLFEAREEKGTWAEQWHHTRSMRGLVAATAIALLVLWAAPSCVDPQQW